MLNFLLVGAGSALGGMLRYGVSFLTPTSGFPYAVLLVNLVGSFLIGFLAGLAWKFPHREFLVVGLLGGFTTFSAFSMETIELIKGGQAGLALLHIVASVLGCLLATWLGGLLGSRFVCGRA